MWLIIVYVSEHSLVKISNVTSKMPKFNLKSKWQKTKNLFWTIKFGTLNIFSTCQVVVWVLIKYNLLKHSINDPKRLEIICRWTIYCKTLNFSLNWRRVCELVFYLNLILLNCLLKGKSFTRVTMEIKCLLYSEEPAILLSIDMSLIRIILFKFRSPVSMMDSNSEIWRWWEQKLKIQEKMQSLPLLPVPLIQ